jgi:hypothetical protein
MGEMWVQSITEVMEPFTQPKSSNCTNLDKDGDVVSEKVPVNEIVIFPGGIGRRGPKAGSRGVAATTTPEALG